MVELRVNAGNVKNPNVHKIGIIALGSHLENHGPAQLHTLLLKLHWKVEQSSWESFILLMR